MEEYNKDFQGPILAEAWEVSCYPGSPSVIEGGRYSGTALEDYIKAAGPGVLGTACSRFDDFPLLVKLIDARENLSLQVHPNDEFAFAHEGQPGKLEMRYIMSAEPGSFIYCGLNRTVSKDEIRQRIEDKTLMEVLLKVPAKQGEVFFIDHGVLHAIGKGITVLEVEQNSNVTYRVYDYGRRGADGRERELHVDKALEVMQLKPAEPRDMQGHLSTCEYFTADRVISNGEYRMHIGEDSFMTITFMEGNGVISCGDERSSFVKGNTFFIPAGSGDIEIEGAFDAVTARV